MRILIIIVLIFSSCNSNDKKNNKKVNFLNKIEKKSNEKKIIVCNYLDKLEEFNRYIGSNAVEELNQYMDYPIDGNIWHLIYINSLNLKYDSSIEFTKKDFIKYGNKVFTSEFSYCFNLIKLDILLEKGEYRTEAIIKKNEDNSINYKYRLNALFNEEDRNMTITMLFEYFEDNEVYESSVNYFFTFKDCHLKMTNIILAG